MQSNGELVLESLEPIEEKLTIAGQNYVLREAGTEAVARYRDARYKGAKVGDDGRLQDMSQAQAESILIAGCLFKVEGNATVGVHVSTIRGWTYRVTRRLFDRCYQICGLDEEDSIEEMEQQIERLKRIVERRRSKNSSVATMVYSA
jgi:hypothetical protein